MPLHTGWAGGGEKEETILRNINPVSRSFFTGQDIKSDGFSIETCKIMVDMLDVSFQAVPRCCFSAWSRWAAAFAARGPYYHISASWGNKVCFLWFPQIKMVALVLAADHDEWILSGDGESPFPDRATCFEVFLAVACYGLSGDRVCAGKRHWLSAWCKQPWLVEFEHALNCFFIWLGLVRAL